MHCALEICKVSRLGMESKRKKESEAEKVILAYYQIICTYNKHVLFAVFVCTDV